MSKIILTQENIERNLDYFVIKNETDSKMLFSIIFFVTLVAIGIGAIAYLDSLI